MGDILKAPENLTNPRDYEAPANNGSQTEGSGKGQINKLSVDQIFNNTGQGNGIAGPSRFGGSTDDKASQSSAEAGSKQSNSYTVDLVSGQHNCR